MKPLIRKEETVGNQGNVIRYRFCGQTIIKKQITPTGKCVRLFGIPVYSKVNKVRNYEEVKRKLLGVVISRKKKPICGDSDNDSTTVFTPLVDSAYKYESWHGSKFYPRSVQQNDSCAEEAVSVIIPCYNGMEHLKKLVPSLFKNTNYPHKFIFINDCSPDLNVLPWLNEQCKGRDDCLVLNNEINLGFPATVNKGVNASSGHIVLLNTDTEVPVGWLERLMKPIWENSRVASVTPFSNAATFHSFPFICDDAINREFLQEFGLEQIDSVLRTDKSEAPYYDSPCGVGFCMAMNRDVWNLIGELDAESFKAGYGEECDWCQRAVKCGFVNVIMPRLFVAHHHGGSFEPEKKRKLLENAELMLKKKHPKIYEDTAKFVNENPWKDIRASALIRLMLNGVKNHKLYFIHCEDTDLAGEKLQKDIEHGLCVWALVNQEKTSSLCIYYKKFGFTFHGISHEALFIDDFKNITMIEEFYDGTNPPAWISNVKRFIKG